MKNLIEENGITYELKGEIYYPVLKMPEQAGFSIGKYRAMYLAFLKEHRKGTYTSLLMSGKLNAYLHEVDEQAREQVTKITAELAGRREIEEMLKFTDPMRWAREMNNCKASAEEIVLEEVIYQ